ncbi:hypothetical protein MHH52_05645 [Paenibacillus sp. FSL K6-0276]|uniref:hypothetical protein n=1 Tax=Paenibacillus sp. FSL K6-0276 TaxID=2921450 RepID=UPI0030EEF6CB
MDKSWIGEDTEEALQLMNQCMEWARANIYLLRILKGDVTVLPEYVAYIEQRKEEIPSGLFKILQAANYYQFNVDDILQQFEQKISDCRDHQLEIRSYNQQIFEDRYTNLMAEIAFYYMNRNQFEISMDYIMESLEYSVKINSESCIIKCAGMFEQLRHTASLETLKEYQNLISKVQTINQKKNGFVIGRLVSLGTLFYSTALHCKIWNLTYTSSILI